MNSATGRWVLLATLLASGTAFLMGTAVIVALPTVQDYFGAEISRIQWVVNAHLLGLSALLLTGGCLGDRLGRKRVFLAGIALFAAGAVLSGSAGSVNLLIVFQALQGVGSALMVPQSLAIINACFVEEHRGQAIGLWAGLSGGIAALGPWLGGWLVEAFSWSAVFFMTVPISISAFLVTLVFVPENRNPQARRLDWLGTVLILLGLLGITYGLIAGPDTGWDRPSVLAGLLLGPAFLLLFVIAEMRLVEPMVPLRIFRNRLVSGANTVTLFLYFSLNGVIFFLVLNLQQVQGYSPVQAGLGLLPPIVLITIFAGPAGSLADRLGPRPQMLLGPLMVAAGITLLALGGTNAAYLKDYLPGLVLFGAGIALVIAPLTKSALSVEPYLSGTASGINNAIACTAGLLAVTLLGAVVISGFTVHLQSAVGASSLTSEEQRQVLEQSDRLAAIVIPPEFGAEARDFTRRAVAESFIFGFRRAMAVSASLALVGALVSFLTIRTPAAPPSPVAKTPAASLE